MNPWRWVDPRARQVRLAAVRAYLEHKDWRLTPNPNPNFLRYEAGKRGKDRPFYYLVPASEEFSDYPMRMEEMITTLSELEDRHPVELLNDILRCGAEAGQENGAAVPQTTTAGRPRSHKRKSLKGTTPP